MIRLPQETGPYESWGRKAEQAFAEKLSNQEHPFPCIPAVQAYRLGMLRIGFAGSVELESTAEEAAALMKDFTAISKDIGDYATLVLFFETTDAFKKKGTVAAAEQQFWNLLNGLKQFDTEPWPDDIPEDPEDPLWEFCFSGERYFMYCGTPFHEKRQSRYFPYMVIAATPRWVLDRFNGRPRQALKMKEQIRKRLADYDDVPAHPALNGYGNSDNYEWKQYFLPEDHSTLSKCPFHSYTKKE